MRIGGSAPVGARIALLVVAAIAAPLGTCLAQAPATPPAPGAAGGPPQGLPTSPDYVIGPGDSLSVYVRGNPDLSTSVPVRPDGKISIPLVNDIQAVGKTPSQLGKDVEAVLSSVIRSPNVSIIVTGFGIGAYDNQIRVVGAGAVKPQSIPFRQGLTLLDVMIEVGLSEFAAGDRAKLVRRVNGEPKETPVKLNRLINRGDLKQNLTLQPGDVLIIPESRF